MFLSYQMQEVDLLDQGYPQYGPQAHFT